MPIGEDLTHLPLDLDPDAVPGDWRDKPVVGCRMLHRTRCHSLDVVECAPGEFEWRALASLVILVLKGRGSIELLDGRRIELRRGQTVCLPEGVPARWSVLDGLRFISSGALPA